MTRYQGAWALSLAAALCATAATPALAQLAPSPNTPALVAAAGGNPQLQSTAAYIGALCPNLTPGTDLRLRCAAALGASVSAPPLATVALDQITPQELLAQGGVIDGAISSGTSAVAGRIAALGQMGGGGRIAAYRPIILAAAGDTAGLGGATVPPLQVFANVVVGGGDKDTNLLETGYDYDAKSVTAGLDYRFSDGFTGGVALAYGETDLDFDANGGKLDAEAVVASAYALFSVSERVQLTALVAYGQIDYSSDRNINYAESATSTISRIAHGETDGDQWEGTLTLSYAMDAKDGWSYGPSFAVSAKRLELDAFEETGANGLNLAFEDQTAKSLQLIAGFDVSRTVSTEGGVISPYGRLQTVYETKDDSRAVRVRYVADTTGFFQGSRLTTSAPDRWRFLLGGGIAAQFTGGWSGFADAETILGLEDVTGYNFTFGVRKEF